MRAALAATALLAAAQTWNAFACGVCVEDRVAAVYDHAIVVRALERRHEVAFLAIEETLPARAELRRSIEAAQGVDRGTARVSLESASLSFAYDPRRAGFGAVLASVEKKLAPRNLKLSMLRVIGEGAAGAVKGVK